MMLVLLINDVLHVFELRNGVFCQYAHVPSYPERLKQLVREWMKDKGYLRSASFQDDDEISGLYQKSIA